MILPGSALPFSLRCSDFLMTMALKRDMHLLPDMTFQQLLQSVDSSYTVHFHSHGAYFQDLDPDMIPTIHISCSC